MAKHPWKGPGMDPDVYKDTLQRIHPPTVPNQQCYVDKYDGCKGDNSTDCAPAFASAINDCIHLNQGGNIVVRGGDTADESLVYFIKGPIHLQSNIQLVIEENAILRFSATPSDYLPIVKTRFEGTEIMNYSPLIYALDCTNIAIRGKGKIDGRGSLGFQSFRAKQTPDQQLVRQMGNDTVPLEERIFGQGHYLRPSMIQFFNCSNVLVQDVTLVDSPFWVIHPVYCRNVIVRGITVDSSFINSDGTDPDSSVDVLIENSVYNTGDDCISIKSGRDADGWRIGKPSKNIIVRNIQCNTSTNAFCIGSELSGGVSNVYVENVQIDSAEMAVNFKSNKDRGAYVSNVTIRNVHAKTTDTYIRFTNNYHSYRGGQSPTLFERIEMQDLSGKSTDTGISILGLPEEHISKLYVSNLILDHVQDQEMIVECTDKMTLDNIVMNGVPIHHGSSSYACPSASKTQATTKSLLAFVVVMVASAVVIIFFTCRWILSPSSTTTTANRNVCKQQRDKNTASMYDAVTNNEYENDEEDDNDETFPIEQNAMNNPPIT